MTTTASGSVAAHEVPRSDQGVGIVEIRADEDHIVMAVEVATGAWPARPYQLHRASVRPASENPGA